MTSLAQILENFDPRSEFIPPPNWRQGRTVYGGLTAALALQAARLDASDDLPSLKSAQISFVGPASDALRFRTQTLRQGKSATSISVDCLAGPEVALRAVFFFANPRSSRIQHEFAKRPAVGRPDDYPRHVGEREAPASLSNFDLRFAGGSRPVTGSDHPEFVAWGRNLDASGVAPAIALVALADSLPPAAVASFTEFAPISSMVWTMNFPQPASPGEWFLLRSASQRAAHGYSFQTMEIWNEEGTLVQVGSQTVAIFA